MAVYELTLPLSDQDVETLKNGDTVYLTGVIFTSRDMGHLEIKKSLEAGKALPVDFTGSAIFHAGPVVKKIDEDWELIVIGPTTSMRMEPYAEMVGQLGVKAVIGKGGMREGSIKAFKKYKQVYLQAAPGCAVKLAAAVNKVEGGFWLEKGMPEALWVLHAERFGPLAVTMDSHGNSIYQDIKEQALKIIEAL
ncbi:FumA C-terminus/TtdB family hydratase beta subunit [Acetonema longum]|uniref:Hydro-lyase, Fe-S type, tartrate/fumarate subfamily, beta subunit n=1 Tax=Acetonema longum DSM 6540 TaxID=1009370 RepID=F7NE27_9FIRM|nr:FumA C-terminus/TtdB family hydratase beta subunit [Acetonema longum]EGO65682.1 hydro-lyase, Fe-S type, tartrate/fumarate subfamily, beta subunit [Acetonema longum DSM 6540]